MSRVHTNQKYLRMIKLLRAVKTPYISRLMALRGFDGAEYEKGWGLLRKAVGPDVPVTGPASMFAGSTKELIESIDQWENTYFDIADATLRHEYPALHERLFLNLTKTTGTGVVLNVETFLRRLDEVEKEGNGENAEALALLDKRGLTQNRRAAAQVQIGEATSLDLTELPPLVEEDHEALRQAEENMWRWFKDWAQIARTIVKDKRLRIYMGVSARGSGGGGAAAGTGDGDDGPEVGDEPMSPMPPMPAPIPIVTPGNGEPTTPVNV